MRSLRPAPGWPPRAAALCGPFAAVALSALEAIAAPPPVKLVEGDVSLELQRGPGAASCPGEPALRERAADSFDFRDPFVPPGTAAAGRMRIEITRQPGGYRAVMSTLDAAGETTAESKEEHVDCDALVWVLAHRIALAVVRKQPPPPAPAPPPDPVAPTPSPPVATSRELAPAVDAPRPPPCEGQCLDDLARRVAIPRIKLPGYSGIIAAGGLVTVGFTQDAAPGAWIGFALQKSWAFLWAEVRASFPAVAMTFDPTRASKVSSVTGVLAPCARRKIFLGCILGEGGLIIYQLPGDASPAQQPLFALGARLGVDVPLGRGLMLRAFGDVLARPLIPRFSVLLGHDPDATLATWETPVVSTVFSLGLAWSS
jgi:hypothetical protein